MAYNQNYGMPYGAPQYQQTYQPQQTNYYGIVNGVDGAKNYPVAFNQSMLLVDANKPVFYKKTSNGIGQTAIECFKLVPITEEEARGNVEEQPQVEFALKADLVALQKKIDALIKQIKKEPKIEGEQVNG